MSEEVRNKIISTAEVLFLKFGFKRVTMDDISNELGMSKKTIYQFFSDKNNLVSETVLRHISMEKNACDCLLHQQENPVAFMLAITDTFGDLKKQINPSVLYDLKKYFKESWDILNKFRVEFIFNQILQNLKEGRDKGFYHSNFDEVLIARFYIHLVDFMINPENYALEKFDFKTIHSEMMKYHLRAICTEKGLKYLEGSPIYQKLL
jgi:AcrR family transcriptional regulator